MEMAPAALDGQVQRPHGHEANPHKRTRTPLLVGAQGDRRSLQHFPGMDDMPDEIVATILGAVASSASSPADLASASMVSKKFSSLVHSKFVCSKASSQCLAVRAKNWCAAAERFLTRCVQSGNVDASYILGMIRFYCLRERNSGAALILAGASGGQVDAIYSLAVIVFNGSGGTRENRDIRAAVALCAHAASLGHVSALRELGFCIHDGYGVDQSVSDGRRLIVLAKAREIVLANTGSASLIQAAVPKLQDVANSFMVEWFALRNNPQQNEATAALGRNATGSAALRMCSNTLCGREESREREFRRCSRCAAAHYCSRACQARHWTTSHKDACAPI